MPFCVASMLRGCRCSVLSFWRVGELQVTDVAVVGVGVW